MQVGYFLFSDNPVIRVPRLLIAAPWSGAGKTTVTAALLTALVAKGMKVQAFKVGPDYIDPGYHTFLTGRTARNLDLWFLGRDLLPRLFGRAVRGADIAVIEGVMGLFDGRGSTLEGSTAEVAALLKAPVVLVLDARSMAASAAALIYGFKHFHPDVNVAGVIINRVNSERHQRLLTAAIEEMVGVPVLGALPARAEVEVPERHLGLLPAVENEEAVRLRTAWQQLASEYLDLKRLIDLAAMAPPIVLPLIDVQLAFNTSLFPEDISCLKQTGLRLAVVRDAAFHFYYQDGLDLLTALGAELRYVSALTDGGLPPDVDGLYIGGGFPELFLPRLSSNRSFIESVRAFYASGKPIYAECGGFMYLCEEIVDREGRSYPMVGLIPGCCGMEGRRVGLGYVYARLATDSVLGPAGTVIKGHEFHYSRYYPRTTAGEQPAYYLYRSPADEERADGYASANLLAGYLHLHFAAHPEAAVHFLRACYKARRR